ncbi:MAG TPA: CBS domain-containing protein [Chitinophagaceae bacterium]|nr:CBS domain-containing protein [Chitinophagaceae bacterium]
MEKVTEILARKLPHFRHISPDTSVNDALCIMSTQNAEYLIVVDDNKNFLGLLTEHDVASKTIFPNKPLVNTKVGEVMNTRLPFVRSDDTVEICMKTMIRYNVRYLPVFHNLSFSGVISSEDILEEALSHRTAIFDEEEKGDLSMSVIG